MAKVKATIIIDLENDAIKESFDKNYTLWELVGQWTDVVCHQGFTGRILRDENGNTVGNVKCEMLD